MGAAKRELRRRFLLRVVAKTVAQTPEAPGRGKGVRLGLLLKVSRDLLTWEGWGKKRRRICHNQDDWTGTARVAREEYILERSTMEVEDPQAVCGFL